MHLTLMNGLKEALIPAILIVVVPTTIVGFIASGSQSFVPFILATLAIILADISSNVINNVADWNIDIHNGRRTALHRNFTQKSLTTVYVILIALLVVFLWTLQANTLLWASVGLFIILGFIYSFVAKLKDRFFLNYATIAVAYGGVSFAIGFFAGNQSLADFQHWIPVVLFIMLIDFGYSMSKDYQDVSGDKKFGKQTLPVVAGKQTAVIVQTVIITLAFVILTASIL